MLFTLVRLFDIFHKLSLEDELQLDTASSYKLENLRFIYCKEIDVTPEIVTRRLGPQDLKDKTAKCKECCNKLLHAVNIDLIVCSLD